jgi:thiamine-phosphate pyrophosphorylase
VITEHRDDARSHVELARLAVEGGADSVQFREKRPLRTAALLDCARRLRSVVPASVARLIVNDRVDVALAADADGAHLGRMDLPYEVARSILGESALLGATANSLEEALAVAARPIDYLGVGPVFGTRSKEDPAPRMGLVELRRIVAAVERPVIAIGGITPKRVAEVLDAGAYGIAVLSAVSHAEDPRAACGLFREAIDLCLRGTSDESRVQPAG